MPVRSLNSAVLKWPGREEVLAAARAWAANLRRSEAAVERILCVGSCARGDWGVGSDLDVIVIARCADLSLLARQKRFEPAGIPVPADLRVYSIEEWEQVAARDPRFVRRIEGEAMNLNDAEPWR